MTPNAGRLDVRPSSDDSVFREFLSEFRVARGRLRGSQPGCWEPPADVYETDSDIVIKVCIPGVSRNELKVNVNGDVVTICGVRRGADAGSVVCYHQMEILNGYFERRIRVRTPFDPQATTARYRDGFLYVLLPKAQELVRHVLTVRLGV